MIRKTSSSEVFDIFASRMISKRSSLNKVAGSLAEALELLFRGAEKVGGKVVADAHLTGLATETSKGIKTLSKAEAVPTKELMTALKNSTAIEEASTAILRKAEVCGYSGYSTSEDFLKQFSKDFNKMSLEFAALGPSPTPTELRDFYSRNEKTIVFFNQLNEDAAFKNIIESNSSLGARHIESGGRTVSRSEAQELQSAGPAAKVMKNLEAVRTGAGLVGTAISIASLVGLVAGGVKFYNYLSSLFSSDEGKRHVESVKDAADCINNIAIKPGSEAAGAKEKVLGNITSYLKYQQFSGETDEARKKEILNEASRAGQDLLGDARTQGSFQNLIALISTDPENSLIGYSSKEFMSILSGAGAGVMIGKSLGGVLGGAIGAAVGGLAGWKALSYYYSGEVDCIQNAADAIKALNDLAAQGMARDKGAPTSGATSATSSSSPSGPGTAATSSSFLENMVGIMTTDEVYNLPGFQNIFVNEKRILRKLVEEAGSNENAAKLILNVNPNINLYLSNIDPSIFKSPITKELVSQNENLKNLARAIVLSAKTARGELKSGLKSGRYEITKETKIKEDNMKKHSESINSQQLIRKAAETRVSYFGDANLGLKDQLTKAYYSGLSGMYNEQPPKKSSDYKDLYGFQEETGTDLVVESHPKSVTLADSMGKGGLVENNLEQQQKSIYVATNTPSGNFQSKYAQTVNYLEKLAKAADSQGKKEVSRLINQTIQKLK